MDPGFVYGSKAVDYIAGQDYYYLENQYIKALIGTTKAPNDKQGPMSNGAIMDAVTQEAKREKLDAVWSLIQNERDLADGQKSV